MLPPTSIGKPLKKRASATKAMILQIDAKIRRLGAARRDRVKALKRIRRELVRALRAEQAAPGSNDPATE